MIHPGRIEYENCCGRQGDRAVNAMREVGCELNRQKMRSSSVLKGFFLKNDFLYIFHKLCG